MTAGSSRIAPRAAAGLLVFASLTACQPGAGGDGPPTSPGFSQPAAGDVGAPGVGDAYTPGDGNGGYDVQHYDLKLRITPGDPAKELDGVADISATATQDLARFNLDLSGLNVGDVKVDGAAARFERAENELVITPAKRLAKNAKFTVRVAYSGTPQPVSDPLLGRYGWIRTPDGVFVACQPSGAHTWYPANSHPSDKATFAFTVTVPDNLTAIANGEPDKPVASTGGASPVPSPAPSRTGSAVPIGHRLETTNTWRVREPMAPYLATVNVGRFEVRQSRTPGGILNITAVDPEVRGVDIDAFHAKNAEITDAWVKLFGPYPFGSTGGLVDNADVGFALETQTRSVYGSFGAPESIVAHEIAHMWFGDSVSITSWKDIWLNEGFASYADWMWDDRRGVAPLQAKFDQLYAQAGNRQLWDVPPGNPGRGQMFDRAVYDRGAMTLHALRTKVGDDKFFDILRAWAKDYRHRNATTPQFIAVAERVSGQQLDSFFDKWLYQRGRPANY
ncbi:M1 family peptidase [Actinomadura craniellae]|uniref:Aminopeptidase N n=1 Tax=Actinomadura craniellae TaxID=2231787 RepID=A0A365H5P4_9ACTN|nr:M1 family metallopeptidase [Actinomadura craniellae]RAY14358.1 M1 family peptidase [Actinomadura craniellae]